MNNPRLQPYNEYEETEYERADQYEQVFPTKSKSKSKQVWVWANQYEQVCVFPAKCMSKFQTNPNPSMSMSRPIWAGVLVIQPDARHAHQTPSRGIYESIKSDFMKMAHPIIASAPRPKSLAAKIARRRNFLDLFSQKFLFFLLGYAKSELNTAEKIDRGLELKADANYKSPGIHRQ